MSIRRRLAAVSLALASALLAASCGDSEDTAADGTTTTAAAESSTTSDGSDEGSTTDGESENGGSEEGTVTIEDNFGTHTIAVPPASVVATDNRTFETLDTWGIELSAAAVSLMPTTIGYKTNSSIVDIGNHREPNLELIIAAEPDVVIVGRRFAQYYDQIVDLVPDAAVINLDPREDEPFDTELKRQTAVLGEIFGKQAEAAQLAEDFDAAAARVLAAYDPTDTVMAVNVSSGEIGYIAPENGNVLGEVVGFLGMTQAFDVANATGDHEGEEISVEAIASANPTWIFVMDRGAAVQSSEPDYKPAAEIIEASEALINVTAVQESQIVYMPADSYTNESIQTYIEFLNDLADALEAAKG